jgi:hypothetical protein
VKEAKGARVIAEMRAEQRGKAIIKNAEAELEIE